MNKIKLIIFDLDGVLVDAKHIHWQTLNLALHTITGVNHYEISWEEHLTIYDGLKTDEKLKMLHAKRGFNLDFADEVWREKQRLTMEQFRLLQPNPELRLVLSELKSMGYMLACCSNSTRQRSK